MTRISVAEPDDVKLRRTIKDRALPAFQSAAELQAWIDEIDGATTIGQLRAVVKDKLVALTINATLAARHD